MSDDRLEPIREINRELEELREQRGKEPLGSPKHSVLRAAIAELLTERDEVWKSR